MEMMMHILLVTGSVLVALLLFSLAVFIHELGHFLAGRLLGLKVEVFSIGFGPALWQKTVDGVVYKISAIPFGGYVALPQLDPTGMDKLQGENSDGAEVLPAVAPWKKIIVAIAGPAGNVVLALFCAAMIAWFAPASATGSSTEVGHVFESSLAYDAGLRAGDVIQTVNGNEIRSWDDFRIECHLLTDAGGSVTLSVLRDDVAKDIVLSVNQEINGEFSLVSGVIPAPAVVGVMRVVEESPAALAGIEAGDRLVSINGQDLHSPEQLAAFTNTDKPLTVVYERGSKVQTVSLMPVYNEEVKRALVGIMPGPMAMQHYQWMTERSIMGQLRADARSIFRLLRALTMPKTEGETGRAAKAMGGPIMIATAIYHVIQTNVWNCLGFIRLICINLAILNLLPLPVLDGGHVMFALYSMIFRRDPNPKVIGLLVNIFAFLLIGVMVIFIFRDAMRLIPRDLEIVDVTEQVEAHVEAEAPAIIPVEAATAVPADTVEAQ